MPAFILILYLNGNVAVFKFVHCADLHLGSRFEGISATDPGRGKRMTESVFRSFERIADLAKNSADMLIISGDIFDERFETPAVRLRFAEALKKAEVPCFICLGNHDHVMSWTESIPYPDNVHVFGKDPESITVDIGGAKAEVTGRSFPDVHSKENPTRGISGKEGVFSIAVIHGNADGGSDSDYAPFKLQDTLNKSIDYWALGHIHIRSVLSENPYVVYPGNIQGRNMKETGEKGAYLVTVTDGRVSDMKFVPTQEILWSEESFDITGRNLPQILEEVKSKLKKDTVVRITFTGFGTADAPLRKDREAFAAQIERAAGCTVHEIILKTRPAADRNAESKNFTAMIVKASDGMAALDREQLIDKICTPKTAAGIRHMVERMSDEELLTLISDAENMLINRLSEAGK